MGRLLLNRGWGAVHQLPPGRVWPSMHHLLEAVPAMVRPPLLRASVPLYHIAFLMMLHYFSHVTRRIIGT